MTPVSPSRRLVRAMVGLGLRGAALLVPAGSPLAVVAGGAALVGTPACYRVAARDGHTVDAHVSRRAWQPFFVFGTFGSARVDVRELCPSGVAHAVAMETGVAELATSIASLGIFTPRAAVVQCARPRKRAER